METLIVKDSTPKATRKHDSTVYGYPNEDGSKILFAVSCRCGLTVVDLPTEAEAERHEREHVLPSYARPFVPEVLYTSKGEEVDVRMTDAEAAEILRRVARERDDAGRPSDFITSLSARFRNRGDWSPGQRPWAHKVANEEADRAKTPETFAEIGRAVTGPAIVESVSFARIVEMFVRAATKLKRPRIEVSFDEGALSLSLAGPRAKFPGSINVTTPGAFDDRTWFGRIHVDANEIAVFGRFEPSRRGAPDWVMAALAALDEDPAAVAAAQGQRYGSCCFCRRELSTTESLSVGYGPVCADKYGLPWGDVPEEAR